MVLTPSLLKPTLLSLSISSICLFSSQLLAEQAPLKKAYQEPSRGFFLEHGTVAGAGKASVELHTGSDGLSSGGGVRLGLSGGEVILNSGIRGYDENEVLVKWGLPQQNSEGTSRTPINWSLLAGLSHFDIDADDGGDLKQTSLRLGISATVKADAGLFTVSPKLIYTDGDIVDDTFFEVDLGAYVGIIETQAGLFSVGAEALITTADDTDNTFAVGGRWQYNEHFNLDIIPFVFGDVDVVAIPGFVRLNAAF